MKYTRPVFLIGAACLVAPSLASAHKASCIDGSIVADYQHMSPVVTDNGDGTTTVRWRDGYRVTIPSCPTVPTPPPVPTPPEVTPPTPVPPVTPPVSAPPPVPLTCAELLAKYPGAGAVRRELWGCPANPTKEPPLKVTKRKLVTAVACKVVGERGYSLVRTRVTWTRGGKVVRIKTSTASRVLGPVCRPPAVAG